MLTDVDYLQQTVRNIKNAEKLIHPSDIKYHQVFRIPVILNKLLKDRCFCDECQYLADQLVQISAELPEYLGDGIAKKKQYENVLHRCRRHLLKKHKITLYNYYTYLYSFISLILALVVISIIKLVHINIHFEFLLAGIAASLILGRIMGKYSDNLQKKRGKQL